MLYQPVVRLGAKGLHVQCRALFERPRGTHGVDARDEAANPLQRVQALQLGPAPTFARADAVGKAVRVVQGVAVQYQRRGQRDFRRLGKQAGVINDGLYAIIIAMSLLTSVVAPPALTALFGRASKADANAAGGNDR